MPTIKIDLFSDPVCPWCLVGLARLDLALSKLPDDAQVDVEHHPFLLDANSPVEGEDVVEMLRRKYGRDPFEMWDRLESDAKDLGVSLDMRKQKFRYASQAAHTLIVEARAKGTQHALAKAIGNAYYLEAQNIADPDVLAQIAKEFGFGVDEAKSIATDELRRQAIEQAAIGAAGQGIQGVPFFVFNNKYALSGSQPIEVFSQVFDTVISESD